MNTTTMTAKEYLNRAYLLDVLINSKLEQVANLRMLATKATAHLSDMPKSISTGKSMMENTIIKLVDLERAIDADIDVLVDTKREIMETIRAVSTPELQALLEMRYLGFQKWTTIAGALKKTVRYVHKLHEKALDCVEKIYFSEDTKRS